MSQLPVFSWVSELAFDVPVAGVFMGLLDLFGGGWRGLGLLGRLRLRLLFLGRLLGGLLEADLLDWLGLFRGGFVELTLGELFGDLLETRHCVRSRFVKRPLLCAEEDKKFFFLRFLS